MRDLIYVRITHDVFSEYDAVSLANRFGQSPDPGLVAKVHTLIGKHWDYIDTQLAKYKIKKIYQDSFWDNFSPDEHLEEARTLSKKSRNMKTICDLVSKGAKIIPCESRAMHNQDQLWPVNEWDSYRRDTNVADVIDRTLKTYETGVCFMGLRHKVDEALKKYKDIRVTVIDWDFKDITDCYRSAA